MITPIALYGGAFDPVHAGHVEVIDFLRSEAGFTEVWVLPTSDQNPKRPKASVVHRLALLELALKLENGKRPGVRIETMETRERGPRFTTETLTALGLARDDVTFVTGTDQFTTLHTWKHFPQVLGQCHWLILERPGVPADGVRAALSRYEIEGGLRRTGDEYRTAQGTVLRFHPVRTRNVSSTEIRRELAIEGRLTAFDKLPPGVDAYLMQHKLYGRTP